MATRKQAGKAQLHRSANGQFYAVLRGGNGRILTQTETFHRRGGAMNNLEAQARVFGGKLPKVEDLT